MDTEDLMTKDWVSFRGKPVRIEEISRPKQRVCVATSRMVAYPKVSEIEPIPLTPEILEKNGFERLSNYQWEYRDNICKIVISIAPKIEIDGEIIGTPPINIMLEGALFIINITSDCYVHELQHALRLCGIEKEIVL